MLRTAIACVVCLVCAPVLAQRTNAPATPQFSHQAVARDAARYEATLRQAFAQLAQSNNASNTKALAQRTLRSGTDPRGAMRWFATTVVIDGSDADAWLGLAKSLLAIKTRANRGAEHYRLPVQASAAAYIAYQRSNDHQERAQALATLGQALKRRSLWRPAINAYKASLALSDNAGVRQAYTSLRAERGFRIVDYTVDNETSVPRVCVQFSEPLRRGGVNYAAFVALDGRDPVDLTTEDRQLCVEGLTHGKRYEISLRAGLPSAIGEDLLKSAVIPIYVRDRAAAVRFSGRAYVLPARGQQGLPVVSINTRRVGIEIYRVAERNLNAVLGKHGDFLERLDSYRVSTLRDMTGAKVYDGELDVATRLNQEVTTAVPVRQAVPQLKPGVYVLVARPISGNDGRDRKRTATQWFIVTDLGLTAFTGDNGLHAFVRSLLTTQPVANANFRLIARNNEVLAQAKADGAGYAHFKPGLMRGEGGMQPAVLIAETPNGQYAFLDLASAALDLSDRGIKGRPQPGALDAYLYADRGVYRPGDTVHLNALLRERTHGASAIPTTLIITRPNGVEHARIVLTDQGLGGRGHDLALSATAMTGTWRVRLHADPKADALARLAFLVEDFVPERMELKLTPAVTALKPGQAGTIDVAGRYLYGPPAAGLTVEGEVIVAAAKQAPEGFPGYQFGRADERFSAVRRRLADVPKTDDAGRTPLQVLLPAIPRTAKPLQARVIVRLSEPGGRTLERTVTLPVETGRSRIGIKPLFKGGNHGEGEPARFDVVLLDETGTRVAGKTLSWTLYRLERRWQWYRENGSWSYDAVTRTRKVGDGQVTSTADAAMRIEHQTKPGRYRLEVADATANGPLSSVTFNAGWYGGDSAESPETLDVALDKPSYQAGDTAKLKVASKRGGKLLLTVLGNGLLLQRTVDVPKGGGDVPFEVGENWGAGAYVAAALYRPLDAKAKRMPTRSIGLTWLRLDPSKQLVKVDLQPPKLVGSGARLNVPLKLSGLGRGEAAYATVAVVDTGILNLTRFKSPDPAGWFFAQTRLSTEIRDLYGRLIDGMRAERGKLRSGAGDDGGLSMSGNPPVERLLALHSGIVKVDAATGSATIDFDLPEFNGEVRVMAVAWSKHRVGHASTEVTVRDPVAITASAPRFLTAGDEAVLDLSLHNVSGAAGRYRLTVNRSTDRSGTSIVNRELELAAGERKSETLTLKPTQPVLTHYDVRLMGPAGVDITRRLTFDVKLPAQDIKRVSVAKLAPKTGGVTLSADLLADLDPDRTTISVSVGPLARLDVPGLLTQLDRYPYGCVEQTVSRALPLLYANALGVLAGQQRDQTIKPRIQGAIARVLEFQSSSGAFGLWHAGNPDLWTTAYVTDFLTRAREAGFQVKPGAFDAALDRLQAFVSYAQDFATGGEARAYALYVLARNGRAPVGELRYFVDTRLDRFATALAQAQLGAALAMLGDRQRAERAFRAAIKRTDEAEQPVRFDFGSNLRDRAALITLASEVRALKEEVPGLADVLAKAFSARQYTSTQEQAWMLLAAHALSQRARDTTLEVNGVPHVGAFNRRLSGSEITSGNLVITNQGEQAVDAVVSVMGAALTPEPPIEKGFSIERSYYRLDGSPVQLDSATGGAARLNQNQRLVVVLRVTGAHAGGRVLLVDRLPAGLEIENPRLVESADLKTFSWLKTKVRPEHTEFRDDRFVAAFNFTGRPSSRRGQPRGGRARSQATVAYLVRAVTPGRFVHPAATVEDMYRPERYARTAAGRLTVSANSK